MGFELVSATCFNGMMLKILKEKVMSDSVKKLFVVGVLAFLMLLTRGSHVLTSVALPDASLALFLVGGLLLRKWAWLVVFAVLATLIDFGAAAVDSLQAFCITDGYWGMFPTYAVMWLAGLWLAQQQRALAVKPFFLASVLSTVLAFVVSTQTYYLFSGRFPNAGLAESLQHGWEYLPAYLGYTMLYLMVFWVLAKALPQLKLQTGLHAQ